MTASVKSLKSMAAAFTLAVAPFIANDAQAQTASEALTVAVPAIRDNFRFYGTVSDASIKAVVSDLGPQTFYPNAGKAFTAGKTSNGEYVGIEFDICGKEVNAVAAYDLNDKGARAAYNAAIDEANGQEIVLVESYKVRNIAPRAYPHYDRCVNDFYFYNDPLFVSIRIPHLNIRIGFDDCHRGFENHRSPWRPVPYCAPVLFGDNHHRRDPIFHRDVPRNKIPRIQHPDVIIVTPRHDNHENRKRHFDPQRPVIVRQQANNNFQPPQQIITPATVPAPRAERQHFQPRTDNVQPQPQPRQNFEPRSSNNNFTPAPRTEQQHRGGGGGGERRSHDGGGKDHPRPAR